MLLVAVMQSRGLQSQSARRHCRRFDDVVAQLFHLVRSSRSAPSSARSIRTARPPRGRSWSQQWAQAAGLRVTALLATMRGAIDRFLDLGRTADRAGHRLALHRANRTRTSSGTSSRTRARGPVERVADHADSPHQSRWSGPPWVGDAEAAPCWSDGIARAPVSTLAGSILAVMMPGSTSPSARISPQGSMISEWPNVSRLFVQAGLRGRKDESNQSRSRANRTICANRLAGFSE